MVKHGIDDRIQVQAFRSLFGSSEGTPEMRFARALEFTSDEAMARAKRANPARYERARQAYIATMRGGR